MITIRKKAPKKYNRSLHFNKNRKGFTYRYKYKYEFDRIFLNKLFLLIEEELIVRKM